MTVAALSATPVKGLRIARCQSLELRPEGIAGDRLFYVIDDDGRLLNGKRSDALQRVSAQYDAHSGELGLSFADGSRLSAPVQLGETVTTRFYSREMPARLLQGPLAQALSGEIGQPVRLVAPAAGGSAADRGGEGIVSLLSLSSVRRLALAAGVDAVDPRRFRMSVEIEGVPAHAEDDWVGRSLRIGDARIRVSGHVGRCLVTTRDPDTGRSDLPTLDVLRTYRAASATTEPLALGVYGAVLRAGTVRVGDRLCLEQ